MILKSWQLQASCLPIALSLSAFAGCLMPARADQLLDYRLKETKMPETKTTQSDCKFVLGQDYCSVETGNTRTVYDFDKKRVLALDLQKKEYTDTDLHSFVYFRVYELHNRYMLGEVLAKAGLKEALFDPFDAQSSLAVILPDDQHKVVINEKNDKGVINFEHDGQISVSYQPSTTVRGAGDERGYSRLLANWFHIHPQIRKAILAEKTFPQHLIVKSGDGSITKTTSEYSLSLEQTIPAVAITPPGDYKLVRNAKLAPIYAALDKLGPSPAMPDKQTAMAGADELLNKGHVLDALLMVLEYGLITGDQSLPEIKKIAAVADKDPQAIKFIGNFSPQSKEDAAVSIKVLETIDRSNLSKGHVIDIMRANIYDHLQDTGKAIAIMREVLIKHPLIVGAYHDLGNMYLEGWDVSTGWDCFRIARKLVSGHTQMEEIGRIEKKLEKDFPDFF